MFYMFMHYKKKKLNVVYHEVFDISNFLVSTYSNTLGVLLYSVYYVRWNSLCFANLHNVCPLSMNS